MAKLRKASNYFRLLDPTLKNAKRNHGITGCPSNFCLDGKPL